MVSRAGELLEPVSFNGTSWHQPLARQASVSARPGRTVSVFLDGVAGGLGVNLVDVAARDGAGLAGLEREELVAAVADRDVDGVAGVVLDQDGKFVREQKYAGLPCGVAIGEKNIYMVNGFAGQLLMLDLNEEGNFEILAASGCLLLALMLVTVAIGLRLLGRDFMLRQ